MWNDVVYLIPPGPRPVCLRLDHGSLANVRSVQQFNGVTRDRFTVLRKHADIQPLKKKVILDSSRQLVLGGCDLSGFTSAPVDSTWTGLSQQTCEIPLHQSADALDTSGEAPSRRDGPDVMIAFFHRSASLSTYAKRRTTDHRRGRHSPEQRITTLKIIQIHNPNAVRKEDNIKSRLNKLELQTMTVKFNCRSCSETGHILCLGFSHHDFTLIVLKFQIVYLHFLQTCFWTRCSVSWWCKSLHEPMEQLLCEL